MNILLIGSGGREHALAWKLAASPLLRTLYAAPGNPGIAQHAVCVPIDITDHAAIVRFCTEKQIDMVVVGPEQPLVAGLADDVRAAGIRCFGPSRAAAQLEGSKGFTKDFCARHNIPTAAYKRFDDLTLAKHYVLEHGAPLVIKADGLAAGKGVVMAETVEDALAAVEAIFSGPHKKALVIEDKMIGEEISLFVLTDGTNALLLDGAQDHKRLEDGDHGPNTGGMGAYSPAPVLTADVTQRIMAEIIQPTIDGLRAEGMPYNGVLFAGLMLTPNGPALIEYNCRFGDPECQVLMPRLQSDLLSLLCATCDGTLADASTQWSSDTALTVVMAARGYPHAPMRGTTIGPLTAAEHQPGVRIFHAGTRLDQGALIADGGRVLNITATGATIHMAQQRAYAAVDCIHWPEGFCRRDIGWRAMS